MKKILFLSAFLCISVFSFSQNDNCTGAISLSVGASCNPTIGTAGSTQSMPGCSAGSTADDDVWFKFVATQTSLQITVVGSYSYDAVFDVYVGSCGSLTSLGSCVDQTYRGQPEVTTVASLTVGTTYYIRVYDYYSGPPPTSTFSICVNNPPAAPSNNSCTSPINLSVNAACSNINATSAGATQSYSMAPCTGGTPDDDVWFTFTANNSQQIINVTPSAYMDPVIELYTGPCGSTSLTLVSCADINGTGFSESLIATGLTVNSIYKVRIYDYHAGSGYPFQICITGQAATGDEPCTAFQLPLVKAECNYTEYNTSTATATSATTAPAPVSCSNGTLAATTGAYSASSQDLWFKVTVPAGGNIAINTEPIANGGTITDGVLALYTGSCNSLSQIACSDNYDYPGTANNKMPYIYKSGLTVGSTVYIRFWGYGSTNGTFGLCVTSPTNDNCADALPICNLNGYSATTAPYPTYTPDRPCNMRGDAEFGTTYTWTPGSTSSYSLGFGMNGSWGSGQPLTNTVSYKYDVSIDNNSWVKFTASNTSATFSVVVANCFLGSGSNAGIQMQIFSGSNCCNFTPVSNFEQKSSGTFTISANSLTVGQDYYLMVDGWGGDVCSYTITANNGVKLSNITASPGAICYATTSTLTAPSCTGCTYTWTPGNQTTQSIVVSPPANQTYSCVVGGVCGSKTTLSASVAVNPLPVIKVNGGSHTLGICLGSVSTLTASGAGVGGTYTWSPSTGLSSTNGANVVVTPTTTPRTYTVTGINSNGCHDTATIVVSGLAVPAYTLNSTSANVCSGKTFTLSASSSSAFSYSWSTGATNTGTVSSISPTVTATGIYTVVATNTATGCKTSATSTLTMLTLPSVSSNTASICNGKSTTLTAGGTGTTFTWSPAATLSSSTGSSVTASPTINTTYTLTATGGNGCTNSVTTNVNVTALPTITVTPSSTICTGTSKTLTSGGATTYTWSTTQTGSSISVTPTVTTTYTVTGTSNSCTNAAVTTITVDPVPTLTASPATFTSSCAVPTGSITGLGVSGSSLSYTWTVGTGTVVGNSSSLTNIPAGNYNVHVVNSFGCASDFGPYTISNPGAPAAPAVTTSTHNACVGDVITFSASTAASSPTYNWTGPSGFSSSAASFTLNSAAVNQTGTYAVSITSSGCTGATTTSTLVVHALPIVSATPSQYSAYCSGTTVSLNGSSASTYTWSGPGGFSSNSQNPAIVSSATTSAGIYTLTATDANGCKSSDTAHVYINQTPAISGVSANSQTLCAGQSLQLNSSVNPAGSAISWNFPSGVTSAAANPSVTAVSASDAGTYSVSATLNGCTSSTTTLTITVNPNPVALASINGNSSICSGNTLNLSGSGGGTYSWNGPNSFSSSAQNPTIANVSSAAAGIYTLTVSFGTGCSSSDTARLYVDPTPTISTANASPSAVYCEGATIQLNGTASPAGTYNWSGPGGFNSNTQNPSIPASVTSSSGNYTLTASLGNCSSSSVVSVTVNPLPTPVASVNGGNSICAGQTLNLSGSGAGSYSWTGPNSYTSNMQNPSIPNSTVNDAGTYTLTVTNSFNCSASDTTFITINVTPSLSNVNASPNPVFCEGETIQLSATASPGNATYNWSGPNSYTNNGQNPAITNSTINNSGTYTLTATLGNCTSAATALSITVNPTPVVVASVSGNSSICQGNTLDLNGTGVGTYNWTGPNSFTSSVQNPSINNAQINNGGTYTLTVTNSFNCSASDTANIQVFVTPVINLVSSAQGGVYCSGETVQLNAVITPTNNILVNWIGPNSFSSNTQNPTIPNSTTAASGTYTLTAGIGTCTASTLPTVAVVVNPTPTVAVAASNNGVYCSGDNIALSSTVTPAASYSWSGPNSYTSTSANPAIANSSTLATGTYTLLATAANCTASATALVTVNQTPILSGISGGSSPYCEGQTIQLSANSNTGANYSWSGPNSFTSNTQNPSIANSTTLNAGTYSVSAVSTVGSCTSVVSIVQVVVNPTPVITATVIGNSILCSTGSATLTALPSVTTNTYAWSGPNGYSANGGTNPLSPLTTDMSGVYTATVTNQFGCTNTSVTTLTVNQTPNAAGLTNSHTCSGGSIALSATGSGTISWYSDTALTNLVNTGSSYNPPVPSGTTLIYYVTVSSAQGCTSITSTVSAGNYNVSAVATADTTHGYAPLTVNFGALVTGASNPTYNWTFADNNNNTSTIQNPQHVFNTGGTYSVTVSGTDVTSGCPYAAELTIVVEDESILIIPNIFTPNGDGINDEFFITSKGVKDITGFIMNRWGQLMFDWNGLNSSWDGRGPNGNMETDGVYMFVLKVTDRKGQMKDYKGTVTLIR